MKKLILLVLIFSAVALAYFEQNDGIPGVYSEDSTDAWILLMGGDSLSRILGTDDGIYFDNVFDTIIVGRIDSRLVYDRQTSIGWDAGEFNTGASATMIGVDVGNLNVGGSLTAIGSASAINNEGDDCTALGHQAGFPFSVDVGNAQDITSVDAANNQVTIAGGHGFGDNETFRNLRITTTDTLPAGLSVGVDKWEIISSTVLECLSDSFTDAGTGTHTLTPSFIFDNWTAVGSLAQPDAANQVMLGDTSVTEVKTFGSITAGGGLTLGGNLIIPDDGFIGSVSDTDAIQIEADGTVNVSQGATFDTTTLVVDAVNHKVVIATKLELPTTIASDVGVIYKDGDRFIHDFHHPEGGGAIPTGQNLFIGQNAGNFTMGETATFSFYSSINTGVGANTLRALTRGAQNTGIGPNVLRHLTIGFDNVGIGPSSLFDCVNGDGNIAIGLSALGDCLGSRNTAVGPQAGRLLANADDCIYLGNKAGYNNLLSDILIIDNQDRGSAAAEITDCLIYGIMNATPANQSLRINGEILGFFGAKLGDGTNETQFSATGVQTMHGDARVMKSVNLEPSSAGENPGGAAFPDDDYIDDFFFHRFSASVEEGVTFHWEIPHDYASAGTVHLHNEWVVENPPTTEGDKVVRIGIEYKKISPGEVFAFAGTATLFINETVAQGETPLIIHHDGGVNFVTTGWEPNDIILIRLYRDATSGTDTYDFNIAPSHVDNDVWMFNHHLEYLCDKIGEAL